MQQVLPFGCFGLLVLTTMWTPAASAGASQVGRFSVFEASFQAAGQYANPFSEMSARAEWRRPDGSTWTVPLFWDGEDTWKLRISPDLPGEWSYTVRSQDRGLDGETGSISCVPSQRRGSIRPMADYGRHFAYQDGSPFLFWGDTAWGFYLDQADEQLDRAAVYRYIDKRAAEGINVVHSMLLSEAAWGNRGGVPFHDMAAQTINPAYWREVDVRLRRLNEQGIIGGLVLAWGDKQRREPWAWRMFPDVAARKRYARYIAARYGAFDVYFIISGEWHAEARTRDNTTEQEVKREFIEIGNAFAAAEAHGRMIAIHPMTSGGSVSEFFGTAWMSFGDYQQNYRDLHERILASRSHKGPVVNSEYGYYLRDSSGDGKVDKHNSFGPEDMRYATWDILMASGYPVTGYGTTYMGGYRDPGPFNPDDPRNDVWANQYRLAKQFLNGLDWWKLLPMDHALSCSQPRSEDREIRVRMSPTRTRQVRRPALTKYWMLAEPGRHYVVYARGLTTELTLRLGPDGEGEYGARLFNPRTGEKQSVGDTLALEAEFKWTPPSAEDWVIHLVRNRPNAGQPSGKTR